MRDGKLTSPDGCGCRTATKTLECFADAGGNDFDARIARIVARAHVESPRYRVERDHDTAAHAERRVIEG